MFHFFPSAAVRFKRRQLLTLVGMEGSDASVAQINSPLWCFPFFCAVICVRLWGDVNGRCLGKDRRAQQLGAWLWLAAEFLLLGVGKGP